MGKSIGTKNIWQKLSRPIPIPINVALSLKTKNKKKTKIEDYYLLVVGKKLISTVTLDNNK